MIIKTQTEEFNYSPYPSLSDLMMTRDKLERGIGLSEIDLSNLERIGIKAKPANKSSFRQKQKPKTYVH